MKIVKVFNGMGFFENINNPIGALVILSNICLNVVFYNEITNDNNIRNSDNKGKLRHNLRIAMFSVII